MLLLISTIVSLINYDNLSYFFIELLTDKINIAKRHNSVLKSERRKQERLYRDTVLDKKLESLERIENRKLERQIVSNFYQFIIHYSSNIGASSTMAS